MNNDMKHGLRKALAIVFLVLVLAIFTAFWFWHSITIPKDPQAKEQQFSIAKGENFLTIAERLKQEGIIQSRLSFIAYGFASGKYRFLQSGDYLLSPAQDIIQITGQLARGAAAAVKITIIEGWNLKDINAYLALKGVAAKNGFLEQASSSLPETNARYAEKFDFLKDKPKNLSLEGYLFPDTYQLKLNETAEELINKTLDNFGKKFTAEMLASAKAKNKTIFDIVIMASLLEREVKTYPDKQLVAGILWKRMAEGWPLQVDATLAYLTNRGSRELTLDDLKIDSPYNTYFYKGLPLGPICNPGQESLKAAIEYQDSPNWFYLSAPDGQTIFSQTLEEHLANQKKYLK